MRVFRNIYHSLQSKNSITCGPSIRYLCVAHTLETKKVQFDLSELELLEHIFNFKSNVGRWQKACSTATKHSRNSAQWCDYQFSVRLNHYSRCSDFTGQKSVKYHHCAEAAPAAYRSRGGPHFFESNCQFLTSSLS